MANIEAIFRSELSERKFLFIPSHLEGYYRDKDAVSDEVRAAFPKASDEIEKAGTTLATGNHTASVFHSMRAAEIGLRSMHSAFPLTLPAGRTLETAEWRHILDALSVVARGIENRANVDQQIACRPVHLSVRQAHS